MPGKYEYYAELAEKTAKRLTDSTENWTSFLTTAARLYKYPYHEQLMIYAQRPDATACADFETWNKRLGRYVRRGSTGIALLDDSGSYPKLKYVFDVSDTGTRSNSRDVNLWTMEERHRDDVSKALGEDDLAENIEQISGRLAREYWNDHQRDIIDIVANSFLEEYNIDTIGARFCKAAAVSTCYSVMSRCGMNPDELLDHEDFLPVFEFNTPDTVAALGTAVSDVSEQILRQIEAIIKNYERTNEYDKPELHENRRLPDSEPDTERHAADRQIWEVAPGLSEESPSDSVQSPDSVGEAVPALSGDRPDSEPENGAADGRVDEIERSDGGSESRRSDEVDRSDEQSEIAGGGDDSDRADLQLTRGEQLSLFDALFPSEAEQIEYIDRAESMKSMPFAFSFAQEEIDTVLKYGGNERDSRMRIAAEFMKDKSAEAHAEFLQNLFHGGNGFILDGREICAWYDENGIHLAQGRSARYVKSAQIISWTDAASRIDELLEQGQFASNVELTEAAGHERQLLAQKLCYMHQDMSGEARKSYFAEFLFSGTFADARDRIADMLADSMKCEAITDELARFSADYADDHSLLRFNSHKPEELLTAFQELSLMNREFISDISEIPAVEQFITEDEINELFASHGSGVENGKQRICDYFTADHTQKEKADFLKNEYGIGGHSHALSRATGSDEWHDGKGIRLKKDGCHDVQLSWQNAVKRIDDLIKKDRYLTRPETSASRDSLTPEDYDRMDNSEPEDTAYTDIVSDTDQKANVQKTPYNVGDTVYIDNTAFEITEIGHFDVQLLDRTLAYPVFRSENRAAFEQMLQQDSRNNGLLAAESELGDGELLASGDKDNFAPVDTIPPENFRITDDNLGEGGAKTKFRMNMDAIYTLKIIENEHRNATPDEQETLSKYVGWGGLAEAFDEDNSSWTREYKELKAALTDDEYAAARSSTLNAHYTSPTVIKAIYEAVGNMGFTTGNILEPSMGVGNFFGLLPQEMSGSRLYGVELDSITGRIAQKLYPKADITVAGFETTDRRDFFDLAVGNVPFGNYKVNDKAYNKLNFSIHDYFFAKTLDQVRPGGVIAFITSRYTMDKQSPEVRKYIAERADLLGAIRLPNNAFKKNAGTEVTTDIIFLQKRDRPQVIEPDWIHLGQTADRIAVNSYFVEHPEMVLGTLKLDDMMYGSAKEVTCEPIEGANLADQLHEAIQHIHGQYKDVELPDLGEEIDTFIPADPNVKNYSYAVVDGDVYYRENSRMVKPSLNPTVEARVKGMVELRDCVQKLIEQQVNGGTDDEIKESQTRLNILYDDFTAKFGLINDRANRQAFSDDSSYYLLCSLEILDEEQHLKRKADMFTKRTIKQNVVATSVDTAAEALALSISEKARVDMTYMSQLTGKSENELVSDLRGVIFRLPESPETYVTADEYLSGNVREKLHQAENAAALDNSFSTNVEALRAAQPKDLDASEIEVRLGATWIDKAYIKQFIVELLDPPYYLRHRIDVNYSDFTAEWNISGKSVDSSNINSFYTYGTDRANAYKIIEDTLNLRDVRIYDTVTDADGKERRVLNAKETTLAQQKQQAIKDAFQDWIWKTPDRRHALVQRYNELFNSTRPREYNGEHITLGGMNPEITLREHQKNAVAHILYGGNTLLAHEVGAGKTFEMVAAAMESKRLGLCNKPLFAVPNHLTEQWASEFLRLYPSANILVATKKDFEPANRKKFCARIATGNYDAIIMGHSQFEKIPMSRERQERQLLEQIDEITEGIEELKESRAERFSIKELERTKKSLQVKLEKLQADERKDDAVTFEQLGVDRLYVDEAHSFKNSFIYTKMRNVAGLSTTDSQKSADMLMKCRYLDELTGSKGVVFATGTPVSNSMTELYTMMRYLQHDTLIKKHLNHFDAWASTFGETTTAIELAPEGTGYRARTRFAKFFNLPELMNLFKEVADIKTSDQLHLPVPEATYHNIVAKPTEIQTAMVQELSERASKVHAGVIDPSVDNMLKITSDGRKLGLDQRIINPDLPDDPMSKVNLCVDNISQIWEDGKADRLTQLVFSDLSTPKEGTFSVYTDIRDKLIRRGVPESEIAFIHDADTEAKKKELFAKVRSGNVRVLIGSTQKMGAGTNCQDRLIALHDLDCPWRPGDLTQRSGRIIRQGNQNKEVHIYRYVTEATFDAYLWHTIENNQKFISQILTSKSPVRACDDIDEATLSYAEVKALCAGDSRIKEKMDLDIEVSKLKLLKANHQSQQYRMQDDILKHFPEKIEYYEHVISGLEADKKTVESHPHPQDGFAGMEIKGKSLIEKDRAGAAILDACKDAKGLEPVTIGSYRGLSMSLTLEDFGRQYILTLKGELSHRVELGKDVRGNLIRIDNVLNQIPARIQVAQAQLENVRSQLETAKAEVGKPFPQEDELRTKSARLNELNAELNIDERTPIEKSADCEKPSVLEKLKTIQPQSSIKTQKTHEEAR